MILQPTEKKNSDIKLPVQKELQIDEGNKVQTNEGSAKDPATPHSNSTVPANAPTPKTGGSSNMHFFGGNNFKGNKQVRGK